MKSRKAQEEFLGFGLIVVIVIVALLIFLVFSLRKSTNTKIKSYESESFIQAALQCTTPCKDNFGFLSLQKVLIKCTEEDVCLNGKSACKVLNDTISDMLKSSWIIGSLVKGYEMNISYEGRVLYQAQEGNRTGNSRGAEQILQSRGNSIKISFAEYS